MWYVIQGMMIEKLRVRLRGLLARGSKGSEIANGVQLRWIRNGYRQVAV